MTMHRNGYTLLGFIRTSVRIKLRVSALIMVTFAISPLMAAPQGGQVVGGSGSISAADANTTVIQQHSSSMAIDWQSFDVGAHETVRFEQPSSSATALNRIHDEKPSEVLGAIDANGRVFLINPNGMLFGESARINVGSLVASGLMISPQDFMNGNYQFHAADGNAGGVVINNGEINARDGGSISLIGSQVHNNGVLMARMGTINLGAGDAAVIDFNGDGLMRFEVTAAAQHSVDESSAQITNTGVIHADGGDILISAKAAQDVFANVINNTGVVQAARIEKQGGVIKLTGNGGDVTSSGVINASAGDEQSDGGVVVVESDHATLMTQHAKVDVTSTHAKGGQVHLLGKHVGLFDAASVDASGAAGGGTVLIGGDYQGQGTVQNADYIYLGQNTHVSANATAQGDGGKVIAWADNGARVHGAINARGGEQAGNGGFVETSGKEFVDITASVNVGAPKGMGGTWLIDPNNITIVAGSTDTNINNTNSAFTSTNDGSQLSVNSIDTALLNGGNGGLVSITTTNSGTNAEAGNITWQAGANLDLDIVDLNTVGERTLELNATNNIVIDQSIQDSDIGNANANINLTLNAGNVVDINQAIVLDSGNLTVASATFDNTGGAVTTNNGNVTINTSGNVTLGATIDSGTGNIAITSTNGSINAANSGAGIELDVDGNLSLQAAGIGNTNQIDVAGDASGDSVLTVNNTGTAVNVNIDVTTDQFNHVQLTIADDATNVDMANFNGSADVIDINGAAGTSTLNNITLSNTDVRLTYNLTDNNANVAVNAMTATDPLAITASGTNSTVSVNGQITGSGDASVSLSGSAINLGNNIVTDSNAISLSGLVNINDGASVTLDTTNSGGSAGANITLSGALNGNAGAGNESMSMTAGGGTVSLAGVGTSAALSSLNVTGANISTGNIGTGSAGVSGTTTMTASNTLTFSGTTYNTNQADYGAASYVVNNGGATTTFTTSSDAITFNTGGITLGDANDLTINSNNGTITLQSINGNAGAGTEDVVLNAANGTLNINGTVGGSVAIDSLDADGATINMASIGGGSAGVNNAATVTATGTLTLSGTTYNTNAATYDASTIAINNGGATTGFTSSADDINFSSGGIALSDANSVSVNSNGGAINLISIDGNAGAGSENVTLNAGAGNVTVSGSLGNTQALASVDIDAANVNINGIGGAAAGVSGMTDIAASNALSFTGSTYHANAAAYSGNSMTVNNGGTTSTFTASNDAITFANSSVTLTDANSMTVNSAGGTITLAGVNGNAGAGAENVTLNAGVGTANITSAIGAVTAVNNLDVDGATINVVDIGAGSAGVNGTTSLTASGALTFNGTTYNTNAATYDAASMNLNGGGTTTFTSSADAITFANASLTLNEGNSLNVAGNGGDITMAGYSGASGGAAENVALNAAAGNIILNGTSYSANQQTLSGASVAVNGGAVTLGANADAINFNSANVNIADSGSLTVNSNGGAITFQGAIDGNAGAGQESLTLNAGAADITVSGAIGSSNTLNGVSVTGNTVLVGNVNTGSGDQTYRAQELTTGSLNGNGSLNIATNDATQNIEISGAGNTTALHLTAATLANIGSDFSALNIGRTDGSGSIVVNDSTFNNALTLQTGGSGQVTLQGNILSSGDSVNVQSNVVLATNSSIDTTNAGGSAAGADITFGGTVNGSSANAQSLTLSAGTGGTISLNGAIGDQTALNELSVNTANTLVAQAINAGNISTSSIVNNTFNGAISTSGSAGVDLNGEEINLNGTVSTSNGGGVTITNTGSLTIASAADMSLAGVFNQDGSGQVNLAGDITTDNQAVTFSGAVNLTDAVAVNTGSGSGNVTFNNSLNGNNAISINAGGGNVSLGNANNVGAITVASSGATTLNGNITANGVVNFTAATGGTGIVGDTSITGSRVLLDGSTISGAGHALTLSAPGGDVSLGNVGANGGELGAITITNADTLKLNGAIYTNADFSAGNANNVVIESNNATIETDSNNSAVNFSAVSVNGSGGLTINTGSGNVQLGAVGQATALAYLDVNSSGTTTLNGNVTTGSGGALLDGAADVDLAADVSMTSSGQINLTGGAVDGAASLNVNAGGALQLGDTGQNIGLNSLTATANNIQFQGKSVSTNNGDISLTVTGGNIALGNLNAGNGDVSLTGSGGATGNITSDGTPTDITAANLVVNSQGAFGTPTQPISLAISNTSSFFNVSQVFKTGEAGTITNGANKVVDAVLTSADVARSQGLAILDLSFLDPSLFSLEFELFTIDTGSGIKLPPDQIEEQ